MNKYFFNGLLVLIFSSVYSFSFSQENTNSSTASSTQPNEVNISEGEILYGYRCKGCHEPATPGAPGRKRLGRLETEEIIESMSKGEMKLMSNNLSENQMRLIAEFLSEG